MSWERIDFSRNGEGVPWVRVGVEKRKNEYPRMRFVMSRSVVKHMGIEAGNIVDVIRGFGEHDGWACLRRGRHGVTCTDRNMGRGNLAVFVSGRHFGVDRMPVNKSVKVTGDGVVLVNGGQVYVELPRWYATAAGEPRVEAR